MMYRLPGHAAPGIASSVSTKPKTGRSLDRVRRSPWGPLPPYWPAT